MAMLDKIIFLISLTFFSFDSPNHQLLYGVWEPGIGPTGHGIACLMLCFLAHGKWDVGVFHVFGERWDGGVVSRSDTEFAARDYFDLLPGGVAILTHNHLLCLDLGDQFRAVGLKEAYSTDKKSIMEALCHRTQ